MRPFDNIRANGNDRRLVREMGEFARQGEDDMHVVGRQQFPLPRLKPAQACVRLASGAMPVAARVIGDGCMSAVGAAIAMSAQRGAAAACDRQQDLLVLPGDPSATAFHKARTGAANDVSQLQRRLAHQYTLAHRNPPRSITRECVRRSCSGFVQVGNSYKSKAKSQLNAESSRGQPLQHLTCTPEPRSLSTALVVGHRRPLIEDFLRPFASFGVAPLRRQHIREIQVRLR